MWEKNLWAFQIQKVNYQIIPNTPHYAQFYAKHNMLMSFFRLFWHLRTHLANGCTKQMEIKRRCSQRRGGPAGRLHAGCWAARGRGLAGPPSLPCSLRSASYAGSSLKQNRRLMLFLRFAFFPQKWKSSWDFFWLSKPGTNVGLS